MAVNEILYLSRRDIEDLALDIGEIIEAIDQMFREKGESRVEMPPKPGIHTQPDAFIHAMPAYIPSLGAAGMKWISGYPGNQQRGLPYINGLLILNDPETGIPLAFMDATWITAKRTGAATAIAARYLARPDSTRAGIVACGVQGRSNLEALSRLFAFERVKAYDLKAEIAAEFAAEMGAQLQLEIEPVKTAAEAVMGMDIVVTSGPILKNPSPPIPAGWLAPGAFASPVDFDSYWRGEAFAAVDKIATDDKDQLAYYRSAGYFRDTPEPYADLGEIVCGKKHGRQAEEERIISINLGLALEDMATAILVYRAALEKGVGQGLPL